MTRSIALRKPLALGVLITLSGFLGDRKRVLLDSQFAYGAPVNVEQISLVTGKVIGKFKLPAMCPRSDTPGRTG